jgi:hypothetical protein
VHEPPAGQLITGPAAVRHGHHQAAAPQARITCRDTPIKSARSAGYAGASRSASSTRARVGSDSACSNRASTSPYAVTAMAANNTAKSEYRVS